MIYPQNFEQKTGFDKVRQLISDKCLSPLGQERVIDMGFESEMDTVSNRLAQTEEFVRILHGDKEFPSSYFFDARYSLKRTYRDWETDRKSTRLNSSHITRSRMPSSA